MEVFKNILDELAKSKLREQVYGFFQSYEKGEYAEAQRFLKAYYNRPTVQKDGWFFLLLTLARASEAWQSHSQIMMNEADSNLRRAKKLLSDNDETEKYIMILEDDMRECRKGIETWNTKQYEIAKIRMNEEEYADAVSSCLDFGNLTEREAHLLDRLRISLGISETRAIEITSEFTPDLLSVEEQEYADQLRFCLMEDAVITCLERGIIERLAKSLGISGIRAAKIEQRVLNGK